MTPELAVARAVSRRAWADAMPEVDLPPWFVGGLVELSARRAVVPLFQPENLSPGYAFFEERYFGGFLPRFVRIRLLPETDGAPLSAYRAAPTANPTLPPRSATESRSLEAKTVLALETLERWVGPPVFDQLMVEFVRESRSRRATLADFARVATDISGQDLTLAVRGGIRIGQGLRLWRGRPHQPARRRRDLRHDGRGPTLWRRAIHGLERQTGG